MAVFDAKAFLKLSGQGTGLLSSLGTSFGVPSCLLNLTREALDVLPSPVLTGIRGTAQGGANRADEVIKGTFAKLRWANGHMEWDSEDGSITWVSDTSKGGVDKNEGSLLGAIGGLLGAAEAAAGFAGRMYTVGEEAYNKFQSAKTCIQGYLNYLKYKDGNSAAEKDRLSQLNPQAFEDLMDAQFNAAKASLDDSVSFLEDCVNLITNIDEILDARAKDPTLEPTFTCDYKNILSGTGLKVDCPEDAKEPEREIFRLIFGPPKSTYGQFILSNDGLYFDSQTSGIIPALMELERQSAKIPQSHRWKFEHAPNLGGRGKGFSTADLNSYVNTILDPSIIDESPFFQTYYDADGVLQDIIGQRNKRIYDLSAQVEDLILENESESLIFNFKQSIYSENSTLQDKINKRKKQIELAVKMPSIYGKGTLFSPGEVPVNDFSYLAGINFQVDIEKQKAVVLSQADVSSVVSPINTPTFVVSQIHNKNTVLDHLLISDIAEGAIIYDGSSVTSLSGVVLDVTNNLTTDGLFAMYNFLQTDVEEPSSTQFLLRNSASESDQNYAQLVCDSVSNIYYRGLAVPYFHGITKHSSIYPAYASGVGSYARLPASKEFNDLLYNAKGATIDFWTYIPNLQNTYDGYDVRDSSGLYRLVLGCENVGIYGSTSSSDTESISNNFGANSVRGFIMGFSRDRRLTENLYPSNENEDNDPTKTVFFLAPTQSISTSAAGLVNRSFYDANSCASGTRYHAMSKSIRESNNGVSFSSCGNNFCHVSITFDPIKDVITFYLDGVEAAVSSMSYVFGIAPHTMPNLPTFKRANSFEYNATSVGGYASNSLKYGPKLNTYFTPWIVGGGYTDGMAGKGNFMGGTYGGMISGLKGYLGSLKFYKKPLQANEVLNNYNVQKNFFKNIDTYSLDWEEIISI